MKRFSIATIMAGILAINKGVLPPMALGAPGKGEGRRRVSRYMPHQNTRQRARYARRVAAGKLNMEISP